HTAEKTGAGNPLVCHALALFYSETGQLGRAAEFEEKFAESPQADKAALTRAAHLYLSAGEIQEALKLAQRVWEANKTDEGTTFDYAQLLLRREDFTQAADVIDLALSAHPQDPQLTLALGVARYGQRRFDDAITAFLKVIQLDPSVEQPYLFLGRTLEQAGEHLPQITKAYEEWAAREPQNAKAQLLLAKALLTENHRSERAQDLLQKSIALDSADWESHYQLGTMLADKRDWAAAAKEFNRSIELDPKQPLPHYHLARVYDRLGQSERAEAERKIHQQLTANGAEPRTK
ncbi:MAG: tetratricopeptide repeat protein, partial [Acidobacteriaceae bacterium]|nr:tetratricopeptide repeat protein [Acidobacteriaceae bacterium]